MQNKKGFQIYRGKCTNKECLEELDFTIAKIRGL